MLQRIDSPTLHVHLIVQLSQMALFVSVLAFQKLQLSLLVRSQMLQVGDVRVLLFVIFLQSPELSTLFQLFFVQF